MSLIKIVTLLKYKPPKSETSEIEQSGAWCLLCVKTEVRILNRRLRNHLATLHFCLFQLCYNFKTKNISWPGSCWVLTKTKPLKKIVTFVRPRR